MHIMQQETGYPIAVAAFVTRRALLWCACKHTAVVDDGTDDTRAHAAASISISDRGNALTHA